MNLYEPILINNLQHTLYITNFQSILNITFLPTKLFIFWFLEHLTLFSFLQREMIRRFLLFIFVQSQFPLRISQCSKMSIYNPTYLLTSKYTSNDNITN
jgi:hypothetical protein